MAKPTLGELFKNIIEQGGCGDPECKNCGDHDKISESLGKAVLVESDNTADFILHVTTSKYGGRVAINVGVIKCVLEDKEPTKNAGRCQIHMTDQEGVLGVLEPYQDVLKALGWSE